jgi:RNA polymerase sigma factor (sigma-70 family)
MGGHETAAEFPITPLRDLAGLRDADTTRRREHLERLSCAYWKPVYAFIRRTWACDREKAQDLTQDFFVWAFESDFLLKFDPACGNFRTFLKSVLRNFVREDHRRGSAAKRGGDVRFVSWESVTEPDTLPQGLGPEEAFDRHWVAEVMAQAVMLLEKDLLGQGHGAWFEAFRCYDLEDQPLSYKEIAERLQVTEGDVRNYLHRVRTRLREILADCLSEYIGSSQDVIAEMRDFLKI